MFVFCLFGICGIGIQRKLNGLFFSVFIVRGNKKVKRSLGERRMGRYYEVEYLMVFLFMIRVNKINL